MMALHSYLIGKVVIKIQCDGCMAEDHKIKLIGYITKISKAYEIWPNGTFGYSDRYDYAVCRVINSRSDEPDTFFYPCIQDGSFQKYNNRDDVYFWFI